MTCAAHGAVAIWNDRRARRAIRRPVGAEVGAAAHRHGFTRAAFAALDADPHLAIAVDFTLGHAGLANVDHDAAVIDAVRVEVAARVAFTRGQAWTGTADDVAAPLRCAGGVDGNAIGDFDGLARTTATRADGDAVRRAIARVLSGLRHRSAGSEASGQRREAIIIALTAAINEELAFTGGWVVPKQRGRREARARRFGQSAGLRRPRLAARARALPARVRGLATRADRKSVV